MPAPSSSGCGSGSPRGVERARHIACQHDPLRAYAPARDRRAARPTAAPEYRDASAGIEFAAGGDLNDLAEIHHGDAMRDMAHDREIVCDEEIGRPKICCMSFRRLSTPAWTETSSAETGSSSTMTSG